MQNSRSALGRGPFQSGKHGSSMRRRGFRFLDVQHKIVEHNPLRILRASNKLEITPHRAIPLTSSGCWLYTGLTGADLTSGAKDFVSIAEMVAFTVTDKNKKTR